MYRVLDILSPQEIAECRQIAASATFVHGKISNPHNKAKQNEQLHEQAAYQRSAKIVLDALIRSEEFREFAFPVQVAPPLLTRYKPGMHYGAHADAAYLQLPHGTVRSDLSCTVFLNEPEDYEGGALHIRLADASMRFKLKPGQAILYPSDTLHEVEPVTKGERLDVYQDYRDQRISSTLTWTFEGDVQEPIDTHTVFRMIDDDEDRPRLADV